MAIYIEIFCDTQYHLILKIGVLALYTKPLQSTACEIQCNLSIVSCSEVKYFAMFPGQTYCRNNLLYSFFFPLVSNTFLQIPFNSSCTVAESSNVAISFLCGILDYVLYF